MKNLEAKITLKSLLELYDNWNGTTRVNDDKLDIIVEDNTLSIYEKEKGLLDARVKAFGFYDDVFTVRIDK